jgi:hypothetical protein
MLIRDGRFRIGIGIGIGIGDPDPDSDAKKNKACRFRYDSKNDIADSDPVPISSYKKIGIGNIFTSKNKIFFIF